MCCARSTPASGGRGQRSSPKHSARCTRSRDFDSRSCSVEKRLAKGAQDHYYGKADVTVYRLIRDGSMPAGRSAIFGVNVMMLTWGGAFWPTYLHGDNRGLIATDSMKNF